MNHFDIAKRAGIRAVELESFSLDPEYEISIEEAFEVALKEYWSELLKHYALIPRKAIKADRLAKIDETP